MAHTCLVGHRDCDVFIRTVRDCLTNAHVESECLEQLQPLNATADTLRMMITEQLVALPDDGLDRWLVRGELQSRPWKHRTPDESSAMTGVAFAIEQWAQQERLERGVVLIDAYHRLSDSPDTTLGIDVSLISSRQWAAARHRPFVEGCPILAAKIISQSDTHETVTDAVREYLDTGVSVVWVVDPDFETVSAYTRSEEPRLFSRGQELTAEPHLPGFRVRVAELFE